MKTIALCSSSAFYEHVNQLADRLQAKGFTFIVPKTKTWYDNPEDFGKKSELIRIHFDEVAKADAILVINDEKQGGSRL